MNYTENLGLHKPELSDQYDVEDFNTNADLIDAKIAEIETEIEQAGSVNTVNGVSPDSNKNVKITASDINLSSEDTTSILSKVTTMNTTLAGKQATLVSGTNIKTINNSSILGTGNIDVVPTTRTVNGKVLSSNVKLTGEDVEVSSTDTTKIGTALGSKQATLVSGTNIKTINSTSLLGSGNISTSDLGAVPTSRTINSKALSSNITLGASDVGAVPTTRTVNGKALSSNITLGASDVSAVPTTRTVNGKVLSSDVTLGASDVSAVPTTRTINSKALTDDITLSASDVSAVPTTRTVNSKALSSNITLSASDVGAVPTGRTINSKALSSNVTLTGSDIAVSSSDTTKLNTALSGKQATLISGTNIKTINSASILGSGDIAVVPTSRTVNSKALSSNVTLTGADIAMTSSDSTKLNSAIDGKQAKLVSGTNIKTINGQSILGSGNLAISGSGNLYMHNITLHDTDYQEYHITLTIFNNSSTQFTTQMLYDWLDDYDEQVYCWYPCNGVTENYVGVVLGICRLEGNFIFLVNWNKGNMVMSKFVDNAGDAHVSYALVDDYVIKIL